jgi:CBS domain-containing protein
MQGKLDRGPVEFKSHIVEQEGEVMAIATRDVISVPPTGSIIGQLRQMAKCGFRRLPVTDAGTKKLRGIVTSGDVINFMGGGDKYKLVQVRHHGNLIAAVNESVRTIMTQQLITLPDDARIRDAVDIIVSKKIGGIPIINEGGSYRHRHRAGCAPGACRAQHRRLNVEDVMSSNPRVTAPDCPISMVTHDMTNVPVPAPAGRERRCSLWDHYCYRYYAVSRKPRGLQYGSRPAMSRR